MYIRKSGITLRLAVTVYGTRNTLGTHKRYLRSVIGILVPSIALESTEIATVTEIERREEEEKKKENLCW